MLNIYCDGGSRGNPGPSASAFVVKDSSGLSQADSSRVQSRESREKIIFKSGKYLSNATNNQAEYQAVILALEWLSSPVGADPLALSAVEGCVRPQSRPELQINFFLDSILVVSQINGLFKIKNPDLRNLLFKIRELESQIKTKIVYSQIPREKNSDADLLVNQTLNCRGALSSVARN